LYANALRLSNAAADQQATQRQQRSGSSPEVGATFSATPSPEGQQAVAIGAEGRAPEMIVLASRKWTAPKRNSRRSAV
jgi:hypothetical protein